MSARLITVLNDAGWVPGLIHASTVIDGVFHAVLSGTTMREDVPLNVAAVPNGPAAPKVTDVAAPLNAVEPEPTAAVALALSLSLHSPMGESAFTDARYDVTLSPPESGMLPGAVFDAPGAEARLPDELPPAVKITIVGVPAPDAFDANTRYMYCVPAVSAVMAYGDVAAVDTLVHVTPSTELCMV